jgi:hypothetical protein
VPKTRGPDPGRPRRPDVEEGPTAAELRPSPSERRDDISDEQIRDLYVTEQFPAPEIARRLDCATTTIHHHLDQLGIPRRQNAYTPTRPDRAGLAQSEASVVYYDERGDPTLVPDPKFQDRVVAETRALLSTVPG